MCTKCFYKCVKQTDFACLILHFTNYFVSPQLNFVKSIARCGRTQNKAVNGKLPNNNIHLWLGPSYRSISLSNTHTHTHTHTQLFLSHAPCSFICSVHTAVSLKCKQGADDGGRACVDPGLGCTFYSRSHPPRGRGGASDMPGIPQDRRGGEWTVLAVGKNPLSRLWP